MSEIVKTDAVIVGAGPVGLFAVFELGLVDIKSHVIDILDKPGGQCAELYPEKPIYDIPGHPAIDAYELIEKLKAQSEPFAPVYHLGQRVEKLEIIEGDMKGGQKADPALSPASSAEQEARRGSKIYKLVTSKGVTIHAKAVVIAAGCGAFGPNRPPIDGLETYEATGGVQYMVTKKDAFRGKRIVIAGGGDSAVDWTLSLADAAEKVYVVHRRPKFRAAPESVSRMEQLAAEGRIEMVIPYQLSGLEGEGGTLTGVKVATLEGEEKTLPADHLLAFFGLAMELGPIADWGLNLHMNHIEVDPATCETNTPGIFAVGDIATYRNKLKLILCGFSEAAMAMHAARSIVFPDTAYHFEYSTSKGVPA